jgi:glutathione synthase/RimK-type ligase-like ATP-grasp enzyme
MMPDTLAVMTDVLLATSADWPEGEPGGGQLLEELAAVGLSAAWAVWDDPAVDWAGAEVVAVRSTWDYDSRREEFLAWARGVADDTRLVHSAEVLAWNTDKIYLLDLVQAGLPVVPTLAVEDESELPPAVAAFEVAVVKPRVGAGGRGVVVFDGKPGGPEGLDESRLEMGPWVVQPLVESVRTEGETSVFVLGGRAVSAVRKQPGGDDIRVHEWYGGRSERAAATEEAQGLALWTVTTAEKLLGEVLPCARVDLMRADGGELLVGELEVTEPGLYLDVVPENAAAYAAALAELLGVAGPSA